MQVCRSTFQHPEAMPRGSLLVFALGQCPHQDDIVLSVCGTGTVWLALQVQEAFATHAELKGAPFKRVIHTGRCLQG